MKMAALWIVAPSKPGGILSMIQRCLLLPSSGRWCWGAANTSEPWVNSIKLHGAITQKIPKFKSETKTWYSLFLDRRQRVQTGQAFTETEHREAFTAASMKVTVR
jgi:hypothetical protein